MKKRRIITDIILILMSCVATGFSLLTNAVPSGASIQYGDITIGSDPANGVNTLVTQSTQKGIINWQSFNIAAGERVHFAQPNVNAITLNRVTGNNISEILGQLTATGRILLINPSGIIFGPNARVNVAGLIASTASISNENFLNDNHSFSQGDNNDARIINQGIINALDNGMIALVAPGVENSGTIAANLGTVILGSAPTGSTYTIDFYGDGLLQFALPPAINSNIADAIVQSGKIKANGGKVLLSANAAKGVVNRTINMSGIIEANSIAEHNGEIILLGNNGAIAEISGTISARGNNSGEQGGTVKLLAPKVGIMSNATIDVSGQTGGGKIFVGGDYKGRGDLPSSEAVYVATGANLLANALNYGNGGRIIIWSDNATRFYGNAEIMGGPLGGNGGFIETSSANWLDVNGATINASAPGNGIAGTWLLDPYNVEIVNTLTQNGSWTSDWWGYTWIASGTPSQILANDIITQLNSAVLMVEISTAGAGTEAGNITVNAPINYTGIDNKSLYLNALGNIVINAPITGNNLELILSADTSGTITDSTSTISVGRFYLQQGSWIQNSAILPIFTATNYFEITPGATFLRVSGGSGAVADPYQIVDIYGLQGIGSTSLLNQAFILANDINASATYSWDSGFTPIGSDSTPFTGSFNGNNKIISDLIIFSSVNSTGLFATTRGATINNLGLTNANISGNDNVGSLIGRAEGGTTINQVFSTGSVMGNDNIGGLIGLIDNSLGNISINNVYSTATVNGNTNVGGLIGRASGTNTTNIDTSYSTGSVAGTSNVGGFIGAVDLATSATITNSFWDTQTSSITQGSGDGTIFSGLTGLTTTAMQNQTTFTNAGWDFTNIWTIITGKYPTFIWQTQATNTESILSEINIQQYLPTPDILDDILTTTEDEEEQTNTTQTTSIDSSTDTAIQSLVEQEENAAILELITPAFECQTITTNQ